MFSTQRIIFSFIFFTFAIGVICSTHVAASNRKESSPSNELEGDSPKMKVGDRWVYTSSNKTSGADTLQLKIIRVNPDDSYIIECYSEKDKDIYHLHYDTTGKLIRRTYIKTGKDIKMNTPPPKYIDFPLFVGKVWGNEYDGPCIDGSYNKYEDRFVVRKIETIPTKAGIFEAFKIYRSIRNLTQHGEGYEKIWYSPEVKRIVKVESSWKGGLELASYRMARLGMELPVIKLASAELESGFTIVTDKKRIEIEGSIRSDGDIKSFKIQGKDVQLDESGNFSYTASLTEGENYIELKALDSHGNKAKKTVVIKYDIPVIASTYDTTKKTFAHKIHMTGARWALVIGVSNYQDTHIPSLRYAASDALSFYNWLISPTGGRYSPARIRLLLEHEATGKNIKSSLFTWLKQAIEEDVLTIYFAGHGSPDSPDSPDNLFLLPYDVQHENIATTGFPMWDIKTALKRFIHAKKIIILADACHSGGVGKSFDVATRAGRGLKVNPISSGLQDLSRVGDGVCVISASADRELSQESRKWGGGHGVFTYYLLKGLNREADYNKDQRVTLGELIPYLSEQVRRATRNAQSPTVAGKFDPALSIGK